MAIKSASERYTSEEYLSKNPNWHEEDAPFKAEKILALLKRNKLEHEVVYEIGCGTGDIIINLSKELKTSQFVGIDISTHAIEMAKQKETESVSFQLKDLNDLHTNKPIDLVLVIDVIEHLENYFEFLRILSTKGKHFIFHIPLDMSVWTLFKEKMLVESKNRVGHIHNFTEDFIKSVIQDNGFEIIDQLYTEPLFNSITIKQKFVGFIRKSLYPINKRLSSKLFGGVSILLLCKADSKHHE